MPDTLALTPYLLVALVAAGMALAFVSADRDSPTSRALALFLFSLGVSIAGYALFYGPHGRKALPAWTVVPETVAIVALMEWLLRVRCTVKAGTLYTKPGDVLLRVAQGVAVLYGLLSMWAPDIRQHEFLGATSHRESFGRLGFWMFAAPGIYIALATGASSFMLLNRRPDAAERVRLIAVNLALPFLFGSFIVSWEAVPLMLGIGEMIVLVGSVHYHVMQGARSQFLGRFLAPQVAALVQQRGISQVMHRESLEISVVCCDLRGFTAYARVHPPSLVIEVLREYYDAVGEKVSASESTIKDFAGDGILILVGAPLPQADHAPRALALARQVRDLGAVLVERWSTADSRLGLGIGVATGVVTVGIIDSVHRLEYTAVGSAVNLASRLCVEALAGEIRVDARTLEMAGEGAFGIDETLALKGFDTPVTSRLLAAVT